MSGFGILQRTAHLGNVFLNEVREYGIYVAQVDQMLSGKVKLSIIVFFESQCIVFDVRVLDKFRADFCPSQIIVSSRVS